MIEIENMTKEEKKKGKTCQSLMEKFPDISPISSIVYAEKYFYALKKKISLLSSQKLEETKSFPSSKCAV